MADSLGKLKTAINNFFRMFSNLVDGFEVKDGRVIERSGGVTNSLLIKPKVGDQEVDIRIDLTATNVGSAFRDALNAIDKISYDNLVKNGVIKEEDEDDEEDRQFKRDVHRMVERMNQSGNNQQSGDVSQSEYIEGNKASKARKRAKQKRKNQPNNNPQPTNTQTTQSQPANTSGAPKLSGNVKQILELLVGANLDASETTGNYNYNNDEYLNTVWNDISLDTAIKNGTGILGIDFRKIARERKFNTPEFKWWQQKAFNVMVYTLNCDSDLYDAGRVTNQKLLSCVDWISRYTNLVTNANEQAEGEGEGTEEVSKEQKYKDRTQQLKSRNTTALLLSIPILIEIQGQLRKVYQDKLDSESSLDRMTSEYGEEAQKAAQEEEELKNSMTEEEYNQYQAEKGFDMDALTEAETQNEAQQSNASKHINVTLRRIQASSDIDILSLDSNYTPGETLEDIDEIINQDQFFDTLTEEPQAYTIDVDDDGFDIEQCDCCPECNPCASLCEAFKAGIRAYRNLYIIHWMSKGNDMMKLHLLAEEMYEELIKEIDTLGELLVEKQGTVPQLDFACDYVPVQDYDFQSSLPVINSLVQMYIDCLDYAYCNQDSDVQSTLDEWLRYWKKQLNYFVNRQEV